MLKKYLEKDFYEFKEKFINDEQFRKEHWESTKELVTEGKELSYEEYNSFAMKWFEEIEKILEIIEIIEISIYLGIVIVIGIAIIRHYKKTKK